MIAKKMKHWWVVAKCRLIDPTCPTVAGEEKLSAALREVSVNNAEARAERVLGVFSEAFEMHVHTSCADYPEGVE